MKLPGEADGSIIGGTEDSPDITITDTYWDTDRAEQDEPLGNATGLTTGQMTGANAPETMDGFAFPANNSDGTWHDTNSYPALSWQDTTVFYSVTIEDTTSPVDEGDTLSVTTTLRFDPFQTRTTRGIRIAYTRSPIGIENRDSNRVDSDHRPTVADRVVRTYFRSSSSVERFGCPSTGS